MILITAEPLEGRDFAAGAAGPADGALATFTGVVRNHSEGRAVERIEYTGYRPLADRELERIRAEAVRCFGLGDCRIIHRLGMLRVGEASLVVVAAAAHREETLRAVAWIIDTLKHTVPIWKREFGPDGSHWVGGCVHPARENPS